MDLSRYINKIYFQFRSYINDISQPSLNRHNTGSQMTLDIPLQKTNTGQQALSVLNIWIKKQPKYSECKKYNFCVRGAVCSFVLNSGSICYIMCRNFCGRACVIEKWRIFPWIVNSL